MSDSSEKDTEILKAIGEIYDAFGIDAEPEKDSALFGPIEDGSLSFNDVSKEIEYTLKAPVELKNGEMLKIVKFREATGGDLEYIRKGIVVERSFQDIDIGYQTVMTLRTLIKIAGISTNVVDRFKRRDIGALSGVLTELGFFYG